jgi:hypothetical protein
VSALGHYLEEAGIPTVAISLVRPQTERTRPPRALWVPFELGRPFGAPGDAAFQQRVVLAALRLLEAPHGPVLLEDFPDDDPRARPDATWQAPLAKAAIPDPSPDALAAALEHEAPQLARRYAETVARRNGRTSVALSGMTIDAATRYVADFLRGKPVASPHADMSPPLAMRFAVDDLKAYYTEAAAGTAKPSSGQLGDWFWNDTVAGATLFALRRLHLESPDDRLKLIAGLFLVPGARVPPAA